MIELSYATLRVVWPGQSHFATMTAPDLVAGALREFFTEVPAQPGPDAVDKQPPRRFTYPRR
jgi:hypothetical protein